MKKLLFLVVLLATTPFFAQEFSMDLVQDLKPRNIGPAGMSGRVTAIDVVTSNPDVMYVGTASGGLWKSTSGGIKWDPIFDKEATASIGAVAIQQSNPSVIWVGTGEGKTQIVAGFGILLNLIWNTKVDLGTSSPVLAARDACTRAQRPRGRRSGPRRALRAACRGPAASA